MAAKRIQVSDDNGSTWFTLPGNQGELRNEAGQIVDTIFGQAWESNQPALLGVNINANGLYKGFAGYVAVLKKPSGASSAMTTEATTLVSGKTYQITNTAKRIMDKNTTTNVFDNGVNQNANVLDIDYLFGRVTFKASYTVTGAVMITGAYWTTAVIAKGRSFNLSMNQDPIDTSVYETVQANGGYKTWDYGLKKASLEIGTVYDATNAWQAALAARSEIIVDISPDGANAAIMRGYFKPSTRGQQGNVGALEEETINLSLSVPDVDLLKRPIGWLFTGSTLNSSIQKSITAFENSTTVDVRYLPDGTTGFAGDAVVADISLSNALEAMNEFSLSYRLTGAPSAV